MKFLCSYAYEISCYRDFIVEAKSKEAAQRKLNRALQEGKFDMVDADASWESGTSNERVFVQGEAKPHSPKVTMEELIGEKNRNAEEETPCK